MLMPPLMKTDARANPTVKTGRLEIWLHPENSVNLGRQLSHPVNLGRVGGQCHHPVNCVGGRNCVGERW